MKPKTIADFTDKELADMVRNSIYVQGTTFDQEHARFLLVLAIPYGPEDDVETLSEALSAFHSFVDDYEWHERTFQVYDHEAPQHFYGASYEGCGETEDED